MPCQKLWIASSRWRACRAVPDGHRNPRTSRTCMYEYRPERKKWPVVFKFQCSCMPHLQLAQDPDPFGPQFHAPGVARAPSMPRLYEHPDRYLLPVLVIVIVDEWCDE